MVTSTEGAASPEANSFPLDPLLSSPRRRAAWRLLVTEPRGTYRSWAQLIGWSVGATHRFITKLEFAGLIRVATRPGYGSVLHVLWNATGATCNNIRPESAIDRRKHTWNEVGTRVEQGRAYDGTPAEPLDKERRTREIDSRSDEKFGHDVVDAGKRVIRIMNSCLNRFSDYRPVQDDQRGSLRAIKGLLETGVPLQFICERLRVDANAFNPEKMGKGKLPGSFAYFQKRIRKRWQEETAFSLSQSDASGRAEPLGSMMARIKVRNRPLTQ